jgi:hypothetical protein
MTSFLVPEPDLQIEFHRRLEAIRESWLIDALLSTVSRLEISQIDRELADLVSPPAMQEVAGWGLRGEILFAVPYVLESKPALLGYYRLLLGFSQKQFYGDRYGLRLFKSMEDTGQLSAANQAELKGLCQTLCQSAQLLLEGTGPLSRQAVHELTLLTLGPQFRGGALNRLGSRATRRVFDLISSLTAPAIITSSQRSIEMRNAAGRTVRVEFASDPDICIREELPSGKSRNLVAIEIKGGRDYSNVHNRIGEAEKSHQKARKDGYVECWTIVGVRDLDLDLARRESPTTDRFYHLERIVEESYGEFGDFRENLLSRIGIRT